MSPGAVAIGARLSFTVLLLFVPLSIAAAQRIEPAAPAPADERPLADAAMRTTLAINVGASLASTVFTYRCIGEGLCREANPLLRDMARDAPAAGVALKAVETAGVTYLLWRLHHRRMHGRWVWITALGITALNVGIAIHDGRIYAQQRSRP
jgi:hypothetical protein